MVNQDLQARQVSKDHGDQEDPLVQVDNKARGDSLVNKVSKVNVGRLVALVAQDKQDPLVLLERGDCLEGLEKLDHEDQQDHRVNLGSQDLRVRQEPEDHRESKGREVRLVSLVLLELMVRGDQLDH